MYSKLNVCFTPVRKVNFWSPAKTFLYNFIFIYKQSLDELRGKQIKQPSLSPPVPAAGSWVRLWKLFQTLIIAKRQACPHPHTRGAVAGASKRDQQIQPMNGMAVESTAAPAFPSPDCPPNSGPRFMPGIRHWKTHPESLSLSYSPLNYRWGHSWGERERMQRADSEGMGGR